MALCIRIVGAGYIFGKANATNVVTIANPQMIPVMADNACAADSFKVYTVAEMDAMLSKAPPLSAERVLDMQAMFYLFLAVLVAVWGAKQLMRLFTGDSDRD